MLPTPSDRFASDRAPRHAAPETSPESTGRHRRPESLADSPPLRPLTSSGNRLRRAQARAENAYPAGFAWRDPHPGGPGPREVRPDDQAHPADDAIRRARRAAGRVQYAAEVAARQRSAGSRPQSSARQSGRPHRRRATSDRGRHAMPAEQDPLAITVRPITLSAVRDWALYTGDKPPATGSHRAPGTLPIESWLLVGKGRQQALLAGLVAVGLALVMIPTANQRNNDVSPVTAAGNRTVTAPPSKAPADRKSAGNGRADPKPEQPNQPAAPEDQPAAADPPAAAPPSGAASPAESPIIAVPPGDGPHRSLRTTGSPTVALTFDDGPDPVQTPKILALLDQYRVKATFCLVGAQVEKHPEIVRQIAAAGHTLCNHTWDHSLLIGKAEPDAIAADLARTNAAIRAVVPDARIPFFRAPGGKFSDRLVQVAYRDGMTSLYWDVDPRDWDHRTDADDAGHADRVFAEVQKFVKPGSIVLSHDFNQPDTVLAYQKLLPFLTENFELGVPSAHEPPPASEPGAAADS